MLQTFIPLGMEKKPRWQDKPASPLAVAMLALGTLVVSMLMAWVIENL